MTTRKAISHKLRVFLWSKQQGKCAICGCELVGNRMEFDHIQALVHGGDNEADNWRILCIDCHKSKTKSDVHAKAKVQRLRYGKPKRSAPMAGSRNSAWKRHLDGTVSKR